LEDTWVGVFDQFDYVLDVQKCVDMFDYGVQSVNNASRSVWKTKVSDELLRIYSGTVSMEEGLKNMQEYIDTAEAE
jgi:multiple sugar transport system substrate-binding protein